MSVFELVKSGGWAMFPLLVCSIVSWAVVAERLWCLRGWTEKNREFLLSFSNAWLKGDKQSAKNLCERSQTDLAQVGVSLFSDQELASDLQKQRFDRRRLELAMDLKRFLWVLGSIGSAAPFIGLFGTVVGIIKSFASMAQTGAGGFAVVAGGISEALVATAGGIVVAVIALFFFNFFQVQVTRFQFQLRMFSEELFEVYSQRNRA